MVNSNFKNSRFGVVSIAQSRKRHDVTEHPMAAQLIMSWCNGKGGLVRIMASLKSFEELLKVLRSLVSYPQEFSMNLVLKLIALR